MLLTQRGFTLLELIVALAIMAFLAALTLPSTSRRPGALEVAAAARELASTLRYARSRAVAFNRPTEVIIDARRGLYQSTEATPRAVAQGLQLAFETPQEQRSARGQAKIRFFPDGSSTGGRIALSAQGLRYDVWVRWLDGRVAIQGERGVPIR
jgi:general secretion pathway protein H